MPLSYRLMILRPPSNLRSAGMHRQRSLIPCSTSNLTPLSTDDLIRCPARDQSGTLMSMTRMPSDLGSVLPGLLGFDHVGVAVADLEAAVTFYRDLLGMQVVHREDNLDQQVAEVMLTTGEATLSAISFSS